MAGSRRSRPAADSPLAGALERLLDEHAAPGARIAVALSGGRDSVALLAAACALRRGDIIAVHVHHGLSPHADAWTSACAELAASLDVPLSARQVIVPPGDPRGVEAAARELRYAALRDAARELGAHAVLLAHHRDDQVETLLVQLGRGAGPHGLAGMPAARRDPDGLLWLRPWLDVPRSAIEAYLHERGLRYVDDESNASTRHRRNAVRHVVVPAFEATFPAFRETLARSASLQAEAAQLIDELAAQDASRLVAGGALDRAGLVALSPHRARNVLRHFLREHGLRAPSTARLAAMLAQLRAARSDARVHLPHDGAVLGVHRGLVVVHAPAPPRFRVRWRGEVDLALPHGVLRFTPAEGEGLAAARFVGREATVRSRAGGERLQPCAERPRRALKSWLQEARVPEWERNALPLVFCDDVLAAVPGLGIDVAFQARRGERAYRLDWQPGPDLSPARLDGY